MGGAIRTDRVQSPALTLDEYAQGVQTHIPVHCLLVGDVATDASVGGEEPTSNARAGFRNPVARLLDPVLNPSGPQILFDNANPLG